MSEPTEKTPATTPAAPRDYTNVPGWQPPPTVDVEVTTTPPAEPAADEAAKEPGKPSQQPAKEPTKKS